MAYVIKKVIKYKNEPGKEYVFYFKGFTFAKELSNLNHAKRYDLRFDAVNEKKKYFGNAKNVFIIKL